MCSFLVFCSLIPKELLSKINRKLRFRGPDHTTIEYQQNISFIHNLLNITGRIHPQPFIKGQVYIVYNGEIYNYKDFGDYQSDGECLVDLYEKYGPSFIEKLDGEFGICLIDFSKQIAIIGSDPFRTKPLYYSLDPVFACSTFKEPLEELGSKHIQPFQPNTYSVFDISTKLLISSHRTYEFDLRQYKTTYDDWVTAFEKAILKRATVTNTTPYICLSSGYDSGGISCALKNLNLDYSIFSIPKNENQGILAQREAVAYPVEPTFVIPEENELDLLRQHIYSTTDDFMYQIWMNKQWSTSSMYSDNATLGIAKICSLAKQSGNRVYLSGSGADEIMSDYAVNGISVFDHSCFSGVFPDELESIFPKSPDHTDCIWKSFYKSTQEAYLMKEEYIGGSYGIEGRYPYLDQQVVQEFLWLTPELKNKAYKAPLDFYLTLHNYPFEREVKRGFSPI